MRWIIRLYPRGWRERYGDEMSELLNNTHTADANPSD